VTQFRMILELEKSHASKFEICICRQKSVIEMKLLSKFYVNRDSLLLTAYSWCIQAYSGAYMAAHQ